MPWVKMPFQEQWSDAADTNAAGFVLKTYLPGTTTPTPMAIDKNGSTTVSTITLNADGLPEVSGNEVVPYIDREFKFAIFENASDAAANSNPYFGFIDNIKIDPFSTGLNQDPVADYAELRALTSADIPDGAVITVTNDGIAGDGVIKTGTVTDNGGTLIVFTDDSNRYWERIYYGLVYVDWFGAVGDTNVGSGVGTDDTTAIQNAIDYTTNTLKGGSVGFRVKGVDLAYKITTELTDNGETLQLVGDVCGEDTNGEGAVIFVSGAINGYVPTRARSGAQHISFYGDNGTQDLTIALVRDKSARAQWHNVQTQYGRGHGYWKDNGNVSGIDKWTSKFNRGHGFWMNDSTTGSTDINGCSFDGLDGSSNTLAGLRIENGFSNFFLGSHFEANGTYGVDCDSAQNHFFGLYVENNGTNDIHWDTNSTRNKIYGYYTANADPTLSVDDNSSSGDDSIDTLNQKFDRECRARSLVVGRVAAGIPGQLQIAEGGTNFELTLEGTGGSSVLECKSSGAGRLDFQINDRIRTGDSAANTNTPAGATAYQLPIYDTSGTLLGYIPIYGAAW